jgi:hypothetical protein
MRQSARVNDQGLGPETIQKYVCSLSRTTKVVTQYNKFTGLREEAIYWDFWIYAINFWAFHCEKGGADSGVTNEWDVVLRAWGAISQAICKFPIPHVPILLSEFPIVLVGARAREDSAKDFKSWIFMVLYKFKTTAALFSKSF